MTVVAFDGLTLAADTMAENAGMRARVSKIRRVGGALLSFTGVLDYGLMMCNWYEAGADVEKWPKFQETDEYWTRLIVVDHEGLKVYERQPAAQRFAEPYMAFGSGRDFAMGAMAMGATAVQAVECAIKHCVSVGGPVEWFNVSDL